VFSRGGADDAGLTLLRSLQSVKFDVEDMRRQEKDLPPADGQSVCLSVCPHCLNYVINVSVSNIAKQRHQCHVTSSLPHWLHLLELML